MKVQQKTKTLLCRDNGRSADFTTPNFILGCGQGGLFPCSYCYVDRWGKDKVYINTNKEDILESCNNWVEDKLWPKLSNQVHNIYYLGDIGCSTDINLHWKDYDWVSVFDWFKEHNKLGATFATKFINKKLLDYNPNKKVRVRLSLMPEGIRKVVEKGTASLLKRIEFSLMLEQAGYDVHYNLSPVIVYKGWEKDWEFLLDFLAKNNLQRPVEVIFLTHNEYKHNKNIEKGLSAEQFLWTPSIQENKVSQYGGNNVRYKIEYKDSFVTLLKKMLVDRGFTVRYIF